MKRICAVCSLILLSLFSATAQTSALSLDESFGVNIDFTDARPGEMKMLAQGGFRWVRMDLKWDATEIEEGHYDFSAYERLMSSLEQQNVRALFILDYGNPLYDHGAPPRRGETRKAFVRWAVAAAKHFQGRGVLWEIYNEPNHELFWPPRPDVDEYISLALQVGRAFQQSVPGEKLIGPATSGVDFAFLEACFKSGLLNYWSAISVHPYRREDPETVAADYRRIRQLIDQSLAPERKKTIPIISGEWGYSTAWANISARKQGELLARSWLSNVSNGVQLSIWYDWKDDGPDPRNAEHNFGTVANVYREHAGRPFEPKPAYYAARTLTTFFAGYTFAARLSMRGKEDYVLSFRNGDEVRVAAWTTSRVLHEVEIPMSAGSYVATDYLGKEVRAYKSVNGVLRISLSNTPIYIKKNHKEM
jgi:polysaccharide biosynthesis protein PslG